MTSIAMELLGSEEVLSVVAGLDLGGVTIGVLIGISSCCAMVISSCCYPVRVVCLCFVREIVSSIVDRTSTSYGRRNR